MAVDHKAERERLREIFTALQNQGRVKSNRDFLGFTGISEGDISLMLNPDGSRNIALPSRYYDPLCKLYGLNKDYLQFGTGPMFAGDEQTEILREILKELRSIKNLLRKKGQV
jgi:hypothetical protein